MKQELSGVIDDLKAVRAEALAALDRNPAPEPEYPEEEKPSFWFRHLFDAEGRVL